MELKSILAIAMVLFVAGGLVFLKFRSKRKK